MGGNDFVSKARSAGLSDDQIVEKLVSGGWQKHDAVSLVAADLEVPPPPPKSAHGHEENYLKGTVSADPGQRFEYHMMFLTMWLAAAAIVWIFNVFLFSDDSNLNTFPLTALLVTMPLFVVLFSRVRRSEKINPALKLDKQRRATVQSTLSVSFILVIVHTIIALYQLLSANEYASKQFVSLVGTYLTFGSILVYFWIDIHRAPPAA